MRLEGLPTPGNRDDPLETIKGVVRVLNQLVETVNDIVWREQQRNRQTHKNVEKVGDGDLLWCRDCDGGEAELWDATCRARQGLDSM